MCAVFRPTPFSSARSDGSRPSCLSRRWLVTLLLWLGAMLASPAWAQRPPNVTAGELALLPEYCPDTMGFNYGDRHGGNASPRAPYWVSLMGESFWHQHHYCWALIKKRRALAPGQSRVLRIGGLQSAMGDFNYLVTNAAPDFIMLPEVYYEIGDTLILLENYGGAREALEIARRKKPDYWPACTRWAEFLAKLGKASDARDHVLVCLKAAPRQAELLAAYREYGGDAEAYLRALPPEGAAAPASGARN